MGKDFRVAKEKNRPIEESQYGLSIEGMNFLSDWLKSLIVGSDKKTDLYSTPTD
jgi:hypothetical protein